MSVLPAPRDRAEDRQANVAPVHAFDMLVHYRGRGNPEPHNRTFSRRCTSRPTSIATSANVRSVTIAPPAKWPLSRRQEYLDWTEQVVSGIRGCNPKLEKLYSELLDEGRRVLGS